jgi:hypothetical protein
MLASSAAVLRPHRIVEIVQRARAEAQSIRIAQVVRVAQRVDEGPRTEVLPIETKRIWVRVMDSTLCHITE